MSSSETMQGEMAEFVTDQIRPGGTTILHYRASSEKRVHFADPNATVAEGRRIADALLHEESGAENALPASGQIRPIFEAAAGVARALSQRGKEWMLKSPKPYRKIPR